MLLWFQMLTQVTKALFRLSVQIRFFCIRFKCLTVYRIYSNTLFVPWRGFILQTIGIDFYGNDIANAKHNPQQQSSLQYRSCLTLWQHIAVALDHMHLTRQQQKRRKLECADLFHADYPSLVSKLQEVGRPAVHCHFPLDLHFATTQPCFCKDFKHVFYKPHYVVWGSDKQKSYTKSDLNGQTGTDFQISDLKSHFAGAWNGFVKKKKNLLNMIGFQSDVYNNLIWTDKSKKGLNVRWQMMDHLKIWSRMMGYSPVTTLST